MSPKISTILSILLLTCGLSVLSSCDDELLESGILDSITSTTEEPPITEPIEPTTLKPEAEIHVPLTIIKDIPHVEPHSDRTENSGHRSDEFKTIKPIDKRPPHEILDETLRRAMDPSGMPLDVKEIEKVVEMVLIRIKNDPAVRDTLKDLSNDPSNSSLQQRLLDLFLETDDEKVREFIQGVFANIEKYYTDFFPFIEDVLNETKAYAPIAKEFLHETKEFVPHAVDMMKLTNEYYPRAKKAAPDIREAVNTAITLGRQGTKLAAYTGGVASIFFVNFLMVGACSSHANHGKHSPQAGQPLKFSDNPGSWIKQVSRHYAGLWFLGLALESYLVLKAAHHYKALESLKGYFGTGALMGLFIIGQCEAKRAFSRKRANAACATNP
jgi:hypothetical protein